MTTTVEIPDAPHSAEAEQSVIGCVLLDNTAFDRVADLVREVDFVTPEHRAIWATIARLVNATKPADPITVHVEGGHDLAYCNALHQSVVSTAHARRYAEIVRDLSRQRQLMQAGLAIVHQAAAPGLEVVAKVDEAMAKLSAITDTTMTRESVPLADAVVTYLDRLQAEAEGNTRVIQTGLRDLDRMLAGGLREGELMVIGARPKMGKTALVLTLARNIARRYGVLICSQEMPVHELVARHVSALGRINLGALRNPSELKDSGWSAVSEALERMRHMAMILDEQRALTLADVRRKVMEAKRRQGVDVVIIDFLQLMAGEGDNRNQELDRISNGLKAMAGEFRCAVILLSQLTREADKRAGPPVMTDLRDSGAIEAAADIIGLLYREFAHPLGQHTEDWRHHAQLEIVQRNGAPGTINLTFSGEHQYFADWDGASPFKAMGRARSATSKGLS
jgi:replicative DNA helicase